MPHKWLFGNFYLQRAQFGISACSDGEECVGRGCGGQACGTVTLPRLNQAQTCFFFTGVGGGMAEKLW